MKKRIKILILSLLLCLCIVGIAMADVDTAIQVNVHGTSVINVYWYCGDSGTVWANSQGRIEIDIDWDHYTCGGRIYVKDEVADGDRRFKVTSATGTGGWIGGTTILGYYPGHPDNDGSAGYWKSYHLEADRDESTHSLDIWYTEITKNVTQNFQGINKESIVNYYLPGTSKTISTNSYITMGGKTYHCIGWTSGAGNIPKTGTSTTYTISNITQNSSITWVYESPFVLTVKIRSELGDIMSEGLPIDFPIEGLNFSPHEGQHTVYSSTLTTLSAPELIYDEMEDCYYRIKGWYGTGSIPGTGTGHSTSKYITQDSSIRWRYEKVYQLKVSTDGPDTSKPSKVPDPDDPDTLIDYTGPVYYPPYTPIVLSTKLEADTAEGRYRCTEAKTVSGNAMGGNLRDEDDRMLFSFALNGNIDIQWVYKKVVKTFIGQAIQAPSGMAGNWSYKSNVTITARSPGDTAENSFFWDDQNKTLYPVRPLPFFEIDWGNGLGVFAGYSAWPAPSQRSVVNAPVNLQPAGAKYTFREMPFSECYTDAAGTFQQPPELSEENPTGADPIFKPPKTGCSVFRFSDNSIPVFLIVETEDFPKPSDIPEKEWSIGTPITNMAHKDPDGKNGYMYFENAYYDGYGPDKAYDRETRTGSIIPVNKSPADVNSDLQMVVAWYKTDVNGIGWPEPDRVVRYNCVWPDPPDGRIIIASANGSKPLAEYEYKGKIYYQTDRNAPGYNPNEEHALILGNKVYAIRNDLNSAETSEPYVLLKYKSPETGAWKMKIFKVEATGTDDDGKYHDFSYPITAGSLISPLTPLDLLPQSTNSYMESGADWHHRDHKGSHWAKAAGQLSFGAGHGPHSVTAVDINNDDKLDLVVANELSNDISVLLASREPTEQTPRFFKDAENYGAVYGAQSPAIGDLNDDQIMDRVTANTSDDDVSVFIGIGDGTFQDAVRYPVGESPHSVAIGLVNLDQVPDLVVANDLSNDVSALLGNGDGTFQDAVHYPAGNAPRSVSIGYLNQDSIPDLAVANTSGNNVSVLLGNSDGTFQDPVHYTAGNGPQSVAISDLNGDQFPDLVVANGLSNDISVLLGNGDGTFQDAVDYPAGNDPQTVTIGDFNGDDKKDLVVVNSYRNRGFVLLGNGDGTFQDAVHYALVDGAHSDPVGDFDSDDLPDLVVANTNGNSISVLPDNGNHSFKDVLNYPVGGPPRCVALGDFNDDDLLDLAVGIAGSEDVSILLGKDPLGKQAEFENPTEVGVGGSPQTVISGDLDRDEKTDIAVVNQGHNYVAVLLGNGNGAFNVLNPYPAGAPPELYASGDFDGRAEADIAMPIKESNIVSVRFNTQNQESSGYSTIVMHWYYPLQKGFFYPFLNQDTSEIKQGDPVPFLNGGASHEDPPQDVSYVVGWPTDVPILYVGETLTEAKYGLPDLVNMAAAQVIFDENVYRGKGPLAKLFDPFTDRWVGLEELPTNILTESIEGKYRFPDLPYSLRSRLFYDPLNKKLIFKGVSYDPGIGEPLVLLNVMTIREKERLEDFNPEWAATIGQLFDRTRNPQNIRLTGRIQNPYVSGLTHEAKEWAELWGVMLGLEKDGTRIVPQKLVGVPMALTAGRAAGEGYVVLAENDDQSLGAAPVQLHVIKVAGGPYQGEIKVIKSDNPFDEKLTLRHSGDFGGEPEKLYFQWYYKPDQSGLPPLLPEDTENTEGWVLHEEGQGLIDTTIEGPGKLTLSDNWFMVHYYYGDQPGEKWGVAFPALVTETEDSLGPKYWSKWAGAPGGQTAQLAEGWIKRVVSDLNPLDARVKDFRNYATSTDVSMISQLGQRYEGDIALNASAENLNNLGLIEAYETVLQRGEDFSINASPPVDYGPANNALLNAATRIADFYTLLGNEAYADVLDPTIGFDTQSGELGSMASSIFAFQNQLASLLEEELVLLRGRDDTMSTTRARPIYNRLVWNFTNGDGELAYVQTYNIFDQDESGIIDELDAKDMYPQGHGDAWGHYLTGMKIWYGLLRHEYYTWEPRVESVLVGGAPIPVDYLDERKFAETAAAKAKAGAEIVNLTYRMSYVDDPAGQWQGYKDTDTERAWGVDGWARRAGQGAYFDWVVANAMLPAEDPVKTHTGITKIDRTTVPELQVLARECAVIQSQVDQADQGLNPLGLAKGVVPFDINPAHLLDEPGEPALTHFEQVYDRAIIALDNARTAFDYATQYTLMLRSNEDDLNSFRREVKEQERDYWNRLIEIYGYPYDGDIGPGATYAAGYNGPDWIHYMYVDLPDLTGEALYGKQVVYTATFNFGQMDGDDPVFDDELLRLNKSVHQENDPNGRWVDVEYHINSDSPWLVTPDGWGKRRAPGEIQMALSDLIKAHADYKRGLTELEGMIGGIQAAVEILEAKHGVLVHQIKVKDETKNALIGYDTTLSVLFGTRYLMESTRDAVESVTDAVIAGLPDTLGFSTDAMAPVHAATEIAKCIPMKVMEAAIDVIALSERGLQVAKEYEIMGGDRKLFIDDARFEVQQMVKELECMEGDVRSKIQELFTLREVIQQAMGRYLAVIAEGERLISEREMFRKRTAASIQDYRYQDLGFRVFRNDAVQKYRATFDLAARYAYLAATAYDYETNLLGWDTGSGQGFLTDIVRQRSPGVIIGGLPVVGKRGLADPLARLNQNFSVYKGQLGFNNPQTETNRFSLRRELFRLRESSDEAWRVELENAMVPDLLEFPPFRRFCRPFAPDGMGPQPGIVIPFSTEVIFGYNYFGWPLGSGDSAYDPTNFATKVRSVGIWFTGYDTAELAKTPRVYLLPVGADVLRSPSGDGFAIREWHVVDQKLPVPFPIMDFELTSEDWIPMNDSLSEEFGAIRRFSSFRAYPDWEDSSEAEAIAAETNEDSRLIGRSVWNTQWLLIIPGGTLLHDPYAGLDAFIYNVTDIKLFFHTYAYSGY